MSAQQNGGNMETLLFSLEILIRSVRIERECDTSGELAVGVRLLDFPTLLIYQQQKSSDGIIEGEYIFNRGKCCFFKMNIHSVHNQLSNTPLYAMVLDVKEDIPKLLGTSLISLSKVMDRIRVDVTDHGAASSSYGERGRFSICSFDGEKIGSISLSYKLLNLGVGLLPHVADSSSMKSVGIRGKQGDCVAGTIRSLPPESGSDCSPPVSDNELVVDDACLDSKNFNSHSDHTETDANWEDFTVFCPPYLFFSNTSEEKYKKQQEAHSLLNLDLGPLAFEDTYTEEDTVEKIDPNTPALRVKYEENLLRNQQTQTSELTSSELGGALQQLPLLNALLVELSQLNNPNLPKPLLIHPNLAWIYRPASTEPSTRHGSKAQMRPTEAMQKTRLQAGSLKHFHTPRTCSAPACRAAKETNQKEQPPPKNKSSRTSPGKKLVFGTTRAFQLRLKNVLHLRENHCECVNVTMSKEQPRVETRRTMRSAGRKLAGEQRESLNDNTEMAKHSKPWEKEQDGRLSGKSDKSASDGDATVVNVDFDTVGRNVTNENQSNVSQTPSESGEHARERESPAGSRRYGAAFSHSSVDDHEEADYSDDFNSLHASDAPSPNPESSLESSRAKTPRSPFSPDACHSGSERVRTAPTPLPTKSSGSPQHSLSGRRLIRPRTTTSALSLSSDDVQVDGSLSSQTRINSRKQAAGSSSGTDSWTSRGGGISKSAQSSSPAQGLCAQFQSSEELMDDLGTLNFRKECQNISDLLASNLPAYTI
ncbi:microtubule-associated protein 10 [Takifugu flavidus]|nr:microtubule-associated protein 10 [Takifugu flavidus]